MRYQVIAWNNSGERVDLCDRSSEKEALDLSKEFRTPAFRTVKIADAHGSIYHWRRVPLKTQPNKWVRRAVADEAFT